MKETTQTEMAEKIVARVRKLMDKPRLAESVRNPVRARPAPFAAKPAARLDRA